MDLLPGLVGDRILKPRSRSSGRATIRSCAPCRPQRPQPACPVRKTVRLGRRRWSHRPAGNENSASIFLRLGLDPAYPWCGDDRPFFLESDRNRLPAAFHLAAPAIASAFQFPMLEFVHDTAGDPLLPCSRRCHCRSPFGFLKRRAACTVPFDRRCAEIRTVRAALPSRPGGVEWDERTVETRNARRQRPVRGRRRGMQAGVDSKWIGIFRQPMRRFGCAKASSRRSSGSRKSAASRWICGDYRSVRCCCPALRSTEASGMRRNAP